MRLKTLTVMALVRLYPSDWRREYGPELAEMLLDRPLTASTIGDVLWSGLRQRVRTHVRFAVGAAVVTLLLISVTLGGITWLIESSVHTISQAALREQPGDAVFALMNYADSPEHTLRERNRAVWGLGQLGDVRALPVLQKHYTGGACDHGRRLCQHELRKAIRLCRGSTNILASVWR